ncbi:hypothetical protein [Borrelia sp. RT5S]|uniref:hypothetical protein n=1 Tax=Borrelia sp. RT5S TaxID=2898581 RepID=UPI001E4C3B99|nr:hypothetical protein [Borrelia sp. RT5S]UGQ16654.1 hypothetical protein LSO06_04885 [Borrelia sp. RT5S]
MNINITRETFSKRMDAMIITNNSKIILLTCNEIRNILKVLYDLDYSKSVISKTFAELDAGIRIGKTDYIAEEFIQYLFFRNMQNPLKIWDKIARKKTKLLQDIDPELLEFGFQSNKMKRIKKNPPMNKEEKRIKKLEKVQIELEITKRLKKKKSILYK